LPWQHVFWNGDVEPSVSWCDDFTCDACPSGQARIETQHRNMGRTVVEVGITFRTLGDVLAFNLHIR
jgi:hypothetical protein